MTEASRPSMEHSPLKEHRGMGGRRSQAISRVREDLQGKRGVSKTTPRREGDGARVLSDQSHLSNLRVRAAEEAAVSLAESEEHERLGGVGVFEHAGR